MLCHTCVLILLLFVGEGMFPTSHIFIILDPLFVKLGTISHGFLEKLYIAP